MHGFRLHLYWTPPKNYFANVHLPTCTCHWPLFCPLILLFGKRIYLVDLKHVRIHMRNSTVPHKATMNQMPSAMLSIAIRSLTASYYQNCKRRFVEMTSPNIDSTCVVCLFDAATSAAFFQSAQSRRAILASRPTSERSGRAAGRLATQRGARMAFRHCSPQWPSLAGSHLHLVFLS